MQKIIYAALVSLLLTTLICCHSRDVNYELFNGEIRYIDNNRTVVKNVTSKHLSLDGQYHGLIAVYDSLLICWNPKLPNYFFNIFNVDTGKEIASFVRKGVGPQEATSVSPIFQLFKKDNDIMALLLFPHQSQLSFWNISQSIERGTVVLDTTVSYSNRSSNDSHYFFMFYLADNTLFAYVQAMDLDITGEKSTTPFYEKRTIYSDELLDIYPIYKKEDVQRKPHDYTTSSFFYSWDAINPDASKIVQSMGNIPQINIIDTHTGEIVGYREKGGADFSIFYKNWYAKKRYYHCIQADNNYIYATYYGKERWERNEIPTINTIHIFNWHGELMYELKTDRSFFEIWIDQVRNRLYTICLETDEAAYLELNELNL
jgi:hypothetical protein